MGKLRDDMVNHALAMPRVETCLMSKRTPTRFCIAAKKGAAVSLWVATAGGSDFTGHASLPGSSAGPFTPNLG
jgi:hypothetical protein